jgi:predicted ATP-dependent endonuclease of OLD family
MIRLQVKDFSCIKDADFTLGKYNVLIGPQASGKSVICKLVYFFIESISDVGDIVVANKTLDDYKGHVRQKFSNMFPVSAWGTGKFSVKFEMGGISIKITRTSHKKQVNDNLRVTPSTSLSKHFLETQEIFKKLQAEGTNKESSRFHFLDKEQRLKSMASESLKDSLKTDHIQSQTFIPAGRSFFTNMGRTIMAFDEGSMFDPFTLQFARLYTAVQSFYSRNKVGEPHPRREFEFSRIIGGNLIWENEKPFIKAMDGRVMPFSALSSGQQELIPLSLALEVIFKLDTRKSNTSNLLYIEEPEAHLFPSAQSDVIERLVSIIGEENQQRRLVLTTHSPYVLTKLNNLAKAGLLARELPERSIHALDQVVKKKYRIEPDRLKAFALIDGVMKNMVGDDGLIDGEYLDEISNRIGSEFSKLIDLEPDDDDTPEVRHRDG